MQSKLFQMSISVDLEAAGARALINWDGGGVKVWCFLPPKKSRWEYFKYWNFFRNRDKELAYATGNNLPQCSYFNYLYP